MGMHWDEGKIIQFTPTGMFNVNQDDDSGKYFIVSVPAVDHYPTPPPAAIYIGKIDGTPYWILDGDDRFTAIVARPRDGLMLDKDFTIHDQKVIKKACGYIHFHHSFLRNYTHIAAEGKYRLTDNGVMVFPRIDPAIIVLITNSDNSQILVTKNARGAENHLYSPPAGFVEVGETFEEAIEREISEELGRKVSDITYHSSQSWPCPQSLMLGFRAVCTDDSSEFVFPDQEILAARWLTRDEVHKIRAAEITDIIIPEPTTVAGKMIADWLNEESR